MKSGFERDAIERIVSELWEAVHGVEPEFLITERYERFNPDLPWIYLAASEGQTVGVAWGGAVSRAGVIGRAAHIARRLFGTKLGESFMVCDAFRRVSPLFQREVSLQGVGEPMTVWFGSGEEVRYEGGISSITERILRESCAVVELSLYGATVAVEHGGTVFFDGVGIHTRGRSFFTRIWERRAGTLKVEVGESMKRAEIESLKLFQEGVAVEVDIGAFEMKLGEIVTLRPGAKVELPVGPAMRGILKLEGAEVGFVSLAFRDEALVATVEKLSLFPEVGLGEKKERNASVISPMTSLEATRSGRPREIEYQLEEL